MKRTPLKRRPRRRMKACEQLAKENYARAGVAEVCAVTGKGPAPDDRLERHHVISKSALKRLGLAHKIWDPRNRMIVRYSIHRRHTTAHERIPREAVPESAWEFARELGLDWMIERDYPRKEAPAATGAVSDPSPLTKGTDRSDARESTSPLSSSQPSPQSPRPAPGRPVEPTSTPDAGTSCT